TLRNVWQQGMGPEFDPTPEERAKKLEEEIAVFRDGYFGMVLHRVPQLIVMQTVAFVTALLWGIGGRMLIGMGLMKLGGFAAARPARFYGGLVALGYGIGLP